MPLEKKDGGRWEVDTRRMARVPSTYVAPIRPAAAKTVDQDSEPHIDVLFRASWIGALVSGLRL